MAQCDYREVLRAFYSRADARAAVRTFAKALPGLNECVGGHQRRIRELADLASHSGTNLRVFHPSRSLGGGLRGFYIVGEKRYAGIYLNAAHHPLAVSSTFHHELGHHLISKEIEKPRESVVSSFDSEFQDHLDQPLELLADIFASIVVYPRRVAVELFQGVETNTTLLENAAGHLRREYGFKFSSALSKKQSESYLFGLIHYAKLRKACLEEYGI
ncbi:MAG: hypothetical protein ACLQAT_13840 [Candidatus Binataceae bacterium]